MAKITVTQTPDGEVDFESGGPTGDTYARNASDSFEVVFEDGMQEDFLLCGKLFVKSEAGYKTGAFFRFRVDVFPFNAWPLEVQYKLTASRDAINPWTSGYQTDLRFGILELDYRNAYETPDGSNLGGWHSDNYLDQEDLPHISNPLTDTNNGDALISAALFNGYTPKTHSIPRDSIDEDDRIVFGSPGSPGNDYTDNFFVWNTQLSEMISLGRKNFGVVLDPVNQPVESGAPESGIYWVSANASSGHKPEFIVTYEDHIPTIDTADPSAPIAHSFVHTIQFSGSTTDVISTDPTWTISVVPAGGEGASIDATTGLFTWPSPVGPGTYEFTVRYTRTSLLNAAIFQTALDYFDEQTFTLTVLAAPPPAPGPPDRPLAVVGIEDLVAGQAKLEDAVDGDAAIELAISGKAILE